MSETLADRRLHPASLLLAVLRSVIAPWTLPALAFIAFNAGRQDGVLRILKWAPAAIMLIVIGGGLTLFFSWLAWSKFRYGVGERDIVIESGVLNKVKRSIPLSRVQDVNIEQGPLARLLGLAKVKIETGGGAKDEGLLDSVSLEEAERLRQEIREAARTVDAPTAPAPQTATALAAEPALPAPVGEPVFSMSAGRVALSGLFTFSLFYLAAAFAVLEAVGGVMPWNAFPPSNWYNGVEAFWRFAGAARLSTVALFLVSVVVLGVLAGAARTFVRDYGFTLWKEGRRMRRQRGLWTRSQVVVPLARVQLARMSTTGMRRLFGWHELSVQTLGGAVAEEDSSGRQSIAPFATRDEVDEILAQTGPFRLPAPGSLQRVSSRRLFKKLAPLAIPTVALIIAASFVPPVSLALGVLFFIALHTALEWRFHRFALQDGLLYVSKGILSQKLWIVPPASMQVIALRRSPLQRLLGLSTVQIDTAGANALEAVSVDDLSEDRARELVDALRAQARPVASPSRRRRRTGPTAPP